ncbi:unnamed protein product [Lepeophtheirus salmonis]|uniref:(salmon louse) hypothetical protein n=1 Tax=Lepeophtheirus salmonis TaxID=72036 RepID=A0A7R8CL60_LEPSM|nr:unnamed protein product [Lepeophtheirus salmonis]CAF2854400.1 unnamed protein product [Lepeophtheirus salmonis]
MDESTLRDSEVVLLAYARYIDKGDFAKEMLFCKSLDTTTSAADIYGKLANYLHVNNIPIENIIFCTEDGTPVMMGKKKGCLKLLKDGNTKMILVHCLIHRENLVAKNVTPPLNEILISVIKCINAIKANAKCELLFKKFCENENADFLLHTGVKGLSKGNCLKRFMVLYDIFSVFLND